MYVLPATPLDTPLDATTTQVIKQVTQPHWATVKCAAASTVFNAIVIAKAKSSSRNGVTTKALTRQVQYIYMNGNRKLQ